MNTNDDGGPAFPRLGEGFGNPNYDTAGMTLRDWFAGQALAGLLANGDGPNAKWAEHFPSAATWAYGLADSMIAERSK
jgi:hypothetical protein